MSAAGRVGRRLPVRVAWRLRAEDHAFIHDSHRDTRPARNALCVRTYEYTAYKSPPPIVTKVDWTISTSCALYVGAHSIAFPVPLSAHLPITQKPVAISCHLIRIAPLRLSPSADPWQHEGRMTCCSAHSFGYHGQVQGGEAR